MPIFHWKSNLKLMNVSGRVPKYGDYFFVNMSSYILLAYSSKYLLPDIKNFQSTSENSKDNFSSQSFFERDSKSLVNSFSMSI